MPYTSEEQLYHDLNWYFIDHWKRICHVASAGGILPKIISEDDVNNDKFNDIVLNLPERYNVIRNKSVENIILQQGIQNFESYFKDFDTMARKGLYSFDKFDLENPDDPRYFLVAYPEYEPGVDPYPISEDQVLIIKRTKVAVKRTTQNPFNLISYFQAHKIYNK